MPYIKNLVKKLLHIEDTPERTALAYSIGIFLGFSPFVGLHTLMGLAIAFLFGLNRVAILLGIWTNTPWWIVPFYMIATWVGMWVTGFRIGWGALREIFQLGMDRGFMSSNFWGCVTSKGGLLLSFSKSTGASKTALSRPRATSWSKVVSSETAPESCTPTVM